MFSFNLTFDPNMNSSDFQQSITLILILLISLNLFAYISNKFFSKTWKYQYLTTLFFLLVNIYTYIDKDFFSNLQTLFPYFQNYYSIYITLSIVVLSLVEEKSSFFQKITNNNN